MLSELVRSHLIVRAADGDSPEGTAVVGHLAILRHSHR